RSRNHASAFCVSAVSSTGSGLLYFGASFARARQSSRAIPPVHPQLWQTNVPLSVFSDRHLCRRLAAVLRPSLHLGQRRSTSPDFPGGSTIPASSQSL